MKTYQRLFSCLSVALSLSAGVVGDFDLRDLDLLHKEPVSLFLKPAFELSLKDQALLEIFQENILSDDSAFVHRLVSDMKEEQGCYPEPYEQAFAYYTECSMREKHAAAIAAAAKYLAKILLITKEDGLGFSLEKGVADSPGECIALLVGNSAHSSSTLHRHRDMDHVLSALLTPYIGVKHHNVIYLSNHEQEAFTSSDLLTQFEMFAKRLNQTKVGYFHYDGRYSSRIDREMLDSLIPQLQRDVHLVMTVDCAEGSDFLELPYQWTVGEGDLIEEHLSQETPQDLPNIVMLTYSKSSSESEEALILEQEMSGILTEALLDILEAHHYKISYKEVLVHIHRYLMERGLSQTPELRSTRSLNLDDDYMPFARGQEL